MAQTARISAKSDFIIQEMSLLTGKSKVEVIESALEVYRHNERMRLFNDSYRVLSKNKKAWQEELEERKDLEGTLEDGFEKN
jgi:ribosomal protein S24E